jgi:hypothetical protein
MSRAQVFRFIVKLQRQGAMRDPAACAQCDRQHEGFGPFFPRGAALLGGLRMHLNAIDALRSVSHGDRDQFAILAWDLAVLAPNDGIQIRPCLGLFRRELFISPSSFKSEGSC